MKVRAMTLSLTHFPDLFKNNTNITDDEEMVPFKHVSAQTVSCMHLIVKVSYLSEQNACCFEQQISCDK